MGNASAGEPWEYRTQGGIEVRVDVTPIEPEAAVEDLVDPVSYTHLRAHET